MNYLVKRAQQRDDQAFVELIESVKADMYKVARSYLNSPDDIADAIQETIVTCYEKIDRLKEPKYFKTWLTRILINQCNDIIRAGRRECPMEYLPEQEDLSMAMPNHEFEELIDQMDEKYRTILILYYAEGFKIREIAQIMDMEENTVKTRLSRGRRQFQRIYLLDLNEGRRQNA